MTMEKNGIKDFSEKNLEDLEFGVKMWKEWFKISVDLSNVRIEGKNSERFSKGIVVPKELIVVSGNKPYELIIGAMKELFSVNIGINSINFGIKNINNFISFNERWPNNNTYLAYFSPDREAGQDSRLTSKMLREKKIPSATFLERLILELMSVFYDHRHLDMENITICSGSWIGDNGDFVPSVCYGGIGGQARHFSIEDSFFQSNNDFAGSRLLGV